MTAMYCLPSVPRKLIGEASNPLPVRNDQRISPVCASSARKAPWLSPPKTRSPAVDMMGQLRDWLDLMFHACSPVAGSQAWICAVQPPGPVERAPNVSRT